MTDYKQRRHSHRHSQRHSRSPVSPARRCRTHKADSVASSRNGGSKDSRQLYLKTENLQPIGSFKLRGAYNKVASLSAEETRRGVITYSSGNHAQGVAYAARAMGVKAVIVMPGNAPAVKREATLALGAEIILVGPSSFGASGQSRRTCRTARICDRTSLQRRKDHCRPGHHGTGNSGGLARTWKLSLRRSAAEV